MTQEEWRPIVGYEGLYEVSDCGNVRSVQRTIIRSNGVPITVNERMLTPCVEGVGRRGHLVVGLWKQGEEKKMKVHRLVARAFVDGYEECLTVDHINGNRYDNRASNLRWCTNLENLAYARELGLNKASVEGLKRYMRSDEGRKLSSDVSRKPVVRDDGKVYKSARAASIAMGMNLGVVSKQIRGYCKTAGGHTFRYLTPQEREKYSI